MEPTQQSPTHEPGIADTARTMAADAQHALAGAVTSVRATTGNLQAQLADALDSGAAALRQSSTALTNDSASGTADGDAPNAVHGALAAVTPRVAETGAMTANLMERTAMWLRETDLSDLEGRLTSQLEGHPVRTLAIAAGIGLLLARRTD